ncbi:MAG TPA: C40 family peptidase, partial [Candidatus Corynebacterium avicola]|nr:C40 family peptidase [Candidatus Corynebacterium avicola]
MNDHRLRVTSPVTSSRSARAVAGLGITAALALGTAATAGTVFADPADADAASDVDTSPLPTDADGLLERLEEVSRQAQVTSDEVEENRTAIEEARGRADAANKAADRHTAEVDRAREAVENSRGPVTELSQSLYRGAVIDPVTAVAGASNPQDAIDRSAFTRALNDDRSGKLEALQDSLREADEQESRAQRAKATASFQLSLLNTRERELAERNETLDGLKEQIADAVDGLSPEEKSRWVDRNGPIDVDVEEFLGELEDGGDAVDASGVVGAAMSKLGSPYSWGATGPDSFDCSGLMFWAYQQSGKSIPRTSAAQVSGGTSVSREDLQPGDIVGFYPGVTHVGMYIGDGQIVHAS